MKYEINGHVVEADAELSEAEIDEIAAGLPAASTGSMGQVASTAIEAALPSASYNEPLKPTSSNPAMAAAQAAMQTFRDPTRIQASISGGAEQLGNLTAERMGQAGVNPYLSAATGLGVSMASDPSSYIGGGMGKVGGKLDDAAAALVKAGKQQGLDLTIGELRQSKPLLLLERALENTPGGSKVLAPLRQKRMEQLVKLRDSLVAQGGEPQAIEKVGLEIQDLASKVIKTQENIQQAGASKLLSEGANKLGVSQEAPEVLASKALEAIKKSSKDEADRVSAAFSELEDILPQGLKIYPKETVTLAARLKSQLKAAAPSLRNDKLLDLLNDFTPMTDDVGMKGGTALTLSWEQMKASREALTQLINSADGAAAFGVKGGGSVDSAVLKQLKSSLSKDMESMAVSMGGEVSEKYALARAMHGEFKQRFNNDVIRSVIKTADQHPDRFMQTVFAPGRTTEIKNVRQIIGAERFKGLQDRFTSTLFGLDNPAQSFNPAALRQNIARYKPNMLKEVYGEKSYNDMVRLAETVERTGSLPIDNAFGRSLLARSPEKVMNFIIQPNSTQNIVRAKMLVGQEKWNQAVGSWLDSNILAKNPEAAVNPKQFVDLVYKFGEPTLEAVFGKPQTAKLKQLGGVMRLIQRGEEISVNRSQTAGVGGMMELLTHPVTAVLKMAGSTAIAKAYTSPTTVDFMIRGLSALPKTQTALTAARNLGLALGIQAYQQTVPLPPTTKQ